MRHVSAVAAFGLLFVCSGVASALPSGFTKKRIASGLSKPTAMAFSSDGRLFVTERGSTAGGTGRVRVIKNDALLGTAFVSIPVDNTSVSPNERGLLGIALDPNFGSNKFIYVYYTAPTSPPRNRISRFTADGDMVVSGSEKQLLTLNDLSRGNHNGGALAFGKDGKLYIAVGENGTPSNSTNLGNYLGKLLRINADGSVPSDNPFYNSGDGIGARDRIWAYGLRNPFTFAVQPGSGRIFANDVGQASWEEINDITKGKDYGWRGGTTDGDSTAWYRYPASTGKCIAGATFYNPATAPGGFSGYVGKYFFGDYQAGFLKVIDVANKNVATFETGVTGIVDIDVGPDGSLYYLTNGSGEVWKISATSSVEQAIVVSTTGLNLTEGQSGSFTVKLAKQPSANVTVSVARTSGDSVITASQSSLVFSSSNWNSARTVNVSAGEDSDAITESARFTLSATSLASKNVIVNATDNEGSGPKVLISDPKEGDTIRGTGAEFYGGSNLDGSTTKAEFFVDASLRYTDAGGGHYHFGGSHTLFDTTQLKEGAHTLRLTIHAATTGSHELRVNVDNLPSGWNHEDIGAVGARGGASAASGKFTLKGSGADIWGAADEFQFAYVKLAGNSEVKARVSSLQNTHAWAKAGVMIRESLAANAKTGFMLVSAANGLAFQSRATAGGATTSVSGGAAAAPRWLRLRRSGGTLTAFSSTDGSAWTQVGSASVSMANDAYLGLAVTSHADGTIATAAFDNVSATSLASALELKSEAAENVEAEGLDSDAEVDSEGEQMGCSFVAKSPHAPAVFLIGLVLFGTLLSRRRSRW